MNNVIPFPSKKEREARASVDRASGYGVVSWVGLSIILGYLAALLYLCWAVWLLW